MALRNSLLQLIVDSLLLVVETQLLCNVQNIFGMGSLLGWNVWLVKYLLHFVQQAPDFGLQVKDARLIQYMCAAPLITSVIYGKESA